MPKLTVDGIEVEVPAGATILQAGEAAGAEGPKFRHRERLSIAGAFLLCLITIALSKPSSASAQPSPQSDSAYVTATYDVVSCAYNKDRPTMRQALKSLPGTGRSSALFIQAKPGSCLRPPITDLRIREYLLRGAVAEIMFKQDIRPGGTAQAARYAHVFTTPTLEEAQAARSRGGHFAFDMSMLTAAECAVRAAPELSTAVLATPVRSQAERSALKAMLPALGGCVAQGQEIQFDQSMLRAFLAEAVYRAAVEKAQTPSQAAH